MAKKKKSIKNNTLSRHDVKKKAVELRGGKCINCGYDKCMAALTFHHLDPETKKYEISRSFKLDWEILKSELEKTVLLCSNCHAEVHFCDLQIDIDGYRIL